MNGKLRFPVTVLEISNPNFYGCKGLDLIHRSTSDYAIHLTAEIIGEADSILSRTRAERVSERTPFAGDGLWLAPGKPVLRILDRIDPLAKLAAMR
jgi:hypothetical protein